MAKVAYVDRNICIGCNVCENECPEVFNVKEDSTYGAGVLKSFPNDNVDQAPIEAKVQRAIEFCPVQCISWKEKIAIAANPSQNEKKSENKEESTATAEQK